MASFATLRTPSSAARACVEARHRLDDEAVDSALVEPFGLLSEERDGLLEGQRTNRSEGLAERTEGPEDEAPSLRRRAGDANALDVDATHLAVEAVRTEPKPAGAEGVRLEELGAGGDVLLVDGLDEAAPERLSSSKQRFRKMPRE